MFSLVYAGSRMRFSVSQVQQHTPIQTFTRYPSPPGFPSFKFHVVVVMNLWELFLLHAFISGSHWLKIFKELDFTMSRENKMQKLIFEMRCQPPNNNKRKNVMNLSQPHQSTFIFGRSRYVFCGIVIKVHITPNFVFAKNIYILVSTALRRKKWFG